MIWGAKAKGMNMPAIPVEASQALLMAQCSFGNALLAVYLHGSAVAGGLRPHSDVDLLAIVDGPLPDAARKSLAAGLMRVSGRHPAAPEGPRPLELIVFQHADLTPPAYPARSEFIYGEWLRDLFEAGDLPSPASDPEFTLLLAQARQEAKALIGPDAAELLPVIPPSDIRRAIGDALPALLDTLEGDEHNVLLTLARMWHTLATGAFVAKDVAAEWAMRRLSGEAAALVAHAREAYLGEAKDDWRARQREAAQVAAELGARVAALL